METKMVVYVDSKELHSWPPYMGEFAYGTAAVCEIEQNHRFVFDRHTIKQSNKYLLNTSNKILKSRNGFNLLVYNRKTECNITTNKSHPLTLGNAGGIFSSHLA